MAVVKSKININANANFYK